MKALVLAFPIVAAAATAAAAIANHATRHGLVTCAMAIERTARPSADRARLRLVSGRIWLPRASTVIGLSPVRNGSDRFGKLGLDVLAGPPVVLSVPARWRSTYSLAFGGSGAVERVTDGASVLTVRACGGALGHWSAYAGGYEVRRPVCVPLIVRVGGSTAMLRIALGRRCVMSG